ncbi:hypothetical protein C0V72_07725 [Porphyrobacter sp. TH134]|nr:hypothetical protein C0V72_07725 [Porphyrobacter sp. TH134]
MAPDGSAMRPGGSQAVRVLLLVSALLGALFRPQPLSARLLVLHCLLLPLMAIEGEIIMKQNDQIRDLTPSELDLVDGARKTSSRLVEASAGFATLGGRQRP